MTRVAHIFHSIPKVAEAKPARGSSVVLASLQYIALPNARPLTGLCIAHCIVVRASTKCKVGAISLPICTSHLSQPQGKISTRDAHFLKACGNDYLSKNLARILGEISDGLERHREHLALPPRVHIEIRIGGRFDEDAHENRVNIRREDNEERSVAEPFAGNDPREPTVLVVAVLLRIDKIAGAVVVRRAMLRELKEEAGRLTE